MLRHFLPLAFLVAVPSITKAQNLMILEYPIAIPVGDLNSYINEPSFRGFNLGFRHMIDGTRAAGLDVGWQTFYEHIDRGTYMRDNEALTGEQYRYTNAFTASFQIDQIFREGQDIRPYIGIGLGTMYARRSLDLGQYRLEQDPWQFMLQPEAGVSFYLANGNALLLSANYYAGFKSKELEGQSFVAISIGYAFEN
jgi:opacity protein-like surface antigen